MRESLLDNALVLKYFGCEEGFYSGDTRQDRAYRVLQAIQEPIRKGDKFLNYDGGDWFLVNTANANFNNAFHPYALRLPSRFQTQGVNECVFVSGAKTSCPDCGTVLRMKHEHQPPHEKKECEHPFGALWSKALKQDGILHCSLCDKRLFVPNQPPPSEKLEEDLGNGCCGFKHGQAKKPSEGVEEKIKEISGYLEHGENNQFKHLLVVGLANSLRELVRLVREEAGK